MGIDGINEKREADVVSRPALRLKKSGASISGGGSPEMTDDFAAFAAKVEFALKKKVGRFSRSRSDSERLPVLKELLSECDVFSLNDGCAGLRQRLEEEIQEIEGALQKIESEKQAALDAQKNALELQFQDTLRIVEDTEEQHLLDFEEFCQALKAIHAFAEQGCENASAFVASGHRTELCFARAEQCFNLRKYGLVRRYLSLAENLDERHRVMLGECRKVLQRRIIRVAVSIGVVLVLIYASWCSVNGYQRNVFVKKFNQLIAAENFQEADCRLVKAKIHGLDKSSLRQRLSDAVIQKGKSLAREKKFGEAIELLHRPWAYESVRNREIKSVEEMWAGALVQEGYAVCEQEEYAKALELAHSALKLVPSFDRALKLSSLATEGICQQKRIIQKQKIDEFLANAETALDAVDWEKAFGFLKEALKMDPQNSRAQELYYLAEAMKKPRLKITITVEDVKIEVPVSLIPAPIAGDDGEYELKEGERYELSVGYHGKNGYWYTRMSISVDWHGLRTLTVPLKPFDGMFALSDNVSLRMNYVKPGKFKMGDDEGLCDEDTHTVLLKPGFWLGKYEVTQAQWAAIMHSHPAYAEGEEKPVERVSWNDAMEFCKKMNVLFADKLPLGYHFSLPTEAQWEYACRAGKTTEYGGKKLEEVGWYKDNSGLSTHIVGTRQANAWGFYDMYGNVWEWCLDWYGYYSTNDGLAINPQGVYSGEKRVIRGGSAGEEPRNCRATNRGATVPDSQLVDVGFRVALVPTKK